MKLREDRYAFEILMEAALKDFDVEECREDSRLHVFLREKTHSKRVLILVSTSFQLNYILARRVVSS